MPATAFPLLLRALPSMTFVPPLSRVRVYRIIKVVSRIRACVRVQSTIITCPEITNVVRYLMSALVRHRVLALKENLLA